MNTLDESRDGMWLDVAPGYLGAHGIQAMMEERIRQIREKGFTPEHDMGHPPYDLIAAGECYIEYARMDMVAKAFDAVPFNWPWSDEAWSPEESALENLAKGGALIAAAFDRIINEMNPEGF